MSLGQFGILISKKDGAVKVGKWLTFDLGIVSP
jgi:hypothetical protein